MVGDILWASTEGNLVIRAMSSNARRRKKKEEEGHVLKGERRKCSENKYIVHVGLIGLKLKLHQYMYI